MKQVRVSILNYSSNDYMNVGEYPYRVLCPTFGLTQTHLRLFGHSLVGRGLALMIRDTFENNPGLRDLFKRKIVERARFVGLSEHLIDFESQIDMKGTYHDNLRSFYREYPQLAQNSDYFRVKSLRPLSGAALERSWRSFEENSGNEILEPTRMPNEQPLTAIVPELIVTYSIGKEIAMARSETPEPFSRRPTLGLTEADPAASAYREFVRLILDHVTKLAGEKFAKAIVYQIGRDIGRTAFKDRTLGNNIVGALDQVLNTRGWGRVPDLDRPAVDHR